MLPGYRTRITAAVAAVAVAVAMTAAAPAMAVGKRERGFIAGVAGALIVNELLKGSRGPAQAQPFVPPTPPHVPPHVRPAPPPHVRPAPYVEPHRVPSRASSSIHSTTVASVFKSYSQAERRVIQRQLRARGYYRDTIDGAFGPNTYDAIVRYARDTGQGNILNDSRRLYAFFDSMLF